MKFRPPVNGSFSVNISSLGDKRITDLAGYYFVTGEAEGDLHAPIAESILQQEVLILPSSPITRS